MGKIHALWKPNWWFSFHCIQGSFESGKLPLKFYLQLNVWLNNDTIFDFKYIFHSKYLVLSRKTVPIFYFTKIYCWIQYVLTIYTHFYTSCLKYIFNIWVDHLCSHFQTFYARFILFLFESVYNHSNMFHLFLQFPFNAFRNLHLHGTFFLLFLLTSS